MNVFKLYKWEFLPWHLLYTECQMRYRTLLTESFSNFCNHKGAQFLIQHEGSFQQHCKSKKKHKWETTAIRESPWDPSQFESLDMVKAEIIQGRGKRANKPVKLKPQILMQRNLSHSTFSIHPCAIRKRTQKLTAARGGLALRAGVGLTWLSSEERFLPKFCSWRNPTRSSSSQSSSTTTSSLLPIPPPLLLLLLLPTPPPLQVSFSHSHNIRLETIAPMSHKV